MQSLMRAAHSSSLTMHLNSSSSSSRCQAVTGRAVACQLHLRGLLGSHGAAATSRLTTCAAVNAASTAALSAQGARSHKLLPHGAAALTTWARAASLGVGLPRAPVRLAGAPAAALKETLTSQPGQPGQLRYALECVLELLQAGLDERRADTDSWRGAEQALLEWLSCVRMCLSVTPDDQLVKPQHLASYVPAVLPGMVKVLARRGCLQARSQVVRKGMLACGMPETDDMDHMIPKSLAGSHNILNFTALDGPVNRAHANSMTPRKVVDVGLVPATCTAIGLASEVLPKPFMQGLLVAVHSALLVTGGGAGSADSRPGGGSSSSSGLMVVGAVATTQALDTNHSTSELAVVATFRLVDFAQRVCADDR